MLSNPNIIRGSLRDLAISWLAPAHFFYPEEEGHHAFLLSFFKGDTIEFDSGWKLTKKFSFLFHCMVYRLLAMSETSVDVLHC